MQTRSMAWWCATAALLVFSAGCSGPQLRPFPLADPLWEDPDRQHVEVMPDEYFSGFAWDFIDQTFFRSFNRYLTADAPTPSVNVNAFDEVPNSSWFENRLGHHELSLSTLARGACPDDLLDPDGGPWTVTAAKPNGANPGFIITDPRGRGWLLKFDGTDQGEQATAADVFGSRVYHAAGYHAPCNIVVFFRPDILEIAEDAESEDDRGRDIPMERHHIDEILDAAIRLPDGRLRASASLFLEGRPLGPWRYQGVRRDDPNDVVPHEDRRELRGGRLLAAWLNHFDAREQNTLSMWHTDEDGRQYVKHYYLDFGDCLGSRWDQDGLSRRFGNAFYFDAAEILGDLFRFGFALQPWDTAEVSREAPALGYYDAEHFDPVHWKAGYPNPAFARMRDEDGAWMARIIAAFDEERVRVMLDEARIIDDAVDAEAFRTLMARRQILLEHWLRVRSPLDDPRVSSDGEMLCLDDLAVRTGVLDAASVRYEARWYAGDFSQPARSMTLDDVGGAEVCVPIAPDGVARMPLASARPLDALERYRVIDVLVVPVPGADPIPPLRVHAYDVGDGYRIVGIERPADDRPPNDR